MRKETFLSMAALTGAIILVGAACQKNTTAVNTSAGVNEGQSLEVPADNTNATVEMTVNENANVAEETNTNTVMESNENANTAATNTTASTNATVATKAVSIDNFAFGDSTITVKKGTKVTWTNNDAASHTVTSAAGTELSSGTFGSGQTYSHTFNTVGTYSYKCTLHPTMTGTVIVTE